MFWVNILLGRFSSAKPEKFPENPFGVIPDDLTPLTKGKKELNPKRATPLDNLFLKLLASMMQKTEKRFPEFLTKHNKEKSLKNNFEITDYIHFLRGLEDFDKINKPTQKKLIRLLDAIPDTITAISDDIDLLILYFKQNNIEKEPKKILLELHSLRFLIDKLKDLQTIRPCTHLNETPSGEEPFTPPPKTPKEPIHVNSITPISASGNMKKKLQSKFYTQIKNAIKQKALSHWACKEEFIQAEKRLSSRFAGNSAASARRALKFGKVAVPKSPAIFNKKAYHKKVQETEARVFKILSLTVIGILLAPLVSCCILLVGYWAGQRKEAIANKNKSFVPANDSSDSDISRAYSDISPDTTPIKGAKVRRLSSSGSFFSDKKPKTKTAYQEPTDTSSDEAQNIFQLHMGG